jgi:hypothetical protein
MINTKKEHQPLARVAQGQEMQKRFGRQKKAPDDTKSEDPTKIAKVTAYKKWPVFSVEVAELITDQFLISNKIVWTGGT